MLKVIADIYGLGLAVNLLFIAATQHRDLAAYPVEFWLARVCDAAEWPLLALRYAAHLV